jgi:hypothetical protein
MVQREHTYHEDGDGETLERARRHLAARFGALVFGNELEQEPEQLRLEKRQRVAGHPEQRRERVCAPVRSAERLPELLAAGQSAGAARGEATCTHCF